MSTMDCTLANMDVNPRFYHHQYSASTNNIPTYANRNTPSYYVTDEYPTDQGNDIAYPRYSPTFQPWRRQQTQSSLSFIPSTSPLPEQSEYTAQHKRPTERLSATPASPFRSVRRMKQPFQLRLPSSPSVESIQSAARESRLSQTRSGNPMLRTCRSDQNITTTNMAAFGLLPSPPLSDSRESQPSPSSAYFSPKPDSDLDTDHGTPKSSVYTPTTISSEVYSTHGNEATPKRAGDTTNVHMAHSNLMKQYSSHNEKWSPVSTDCPHMSSPALSSDVDAFERRTLSGSSLETQRSRSGTVSSEEGSWVPSNFSYCEDWLQRAPLELETTGEKSKENNRRRIQIVQQSPPPPERKREMKAPADEPVMFAVASKTKPKLVDISRQSSPAMSCSIPTPPQPPVPSTPDLGHQEISAFSPDTPLEMSDSGYATTDPSCDSPSDPKPDKEDDFIPVSSVGSISETAVRDKPMRSVASPKPPPRPDVVYKAYSPPKPRRSVPLSNTAEHGELKKWWDHEWAMDQLEHSIKEYPRCMLRLTSPVIILVRHSDEKDILRRFRQIFPDAADNLLDGLCAALIARNYVLSLASSKRKTAPHGHRPNLSRLDTVPERGSAMLATPLAPSSPSRIRDRVLGSRSGELNKSLDQIIDDLLFAICRKHDGTLKSAVLVLAQVLETKA
ncbi:hypothetical protein ANOM_008601 [Aspergillus nomiae NRRL 13137]|uniref:Uncharacterized protein n=1 Tax=Aspergillus nomiae NRRL (strain ATCC 15546 / NRRL 13137 / CBS 260.88 / M93) TaxID=1509407 RepID=A0A0L1IUF6_ASPN3|nr:uncharacterized protein ANOM_008601 [Aspergillus nomiae NRRL 13137]KNG83114.1 hypothetical protein ANOM_008601 [Aspergillus nomiae NRRL 13137]